MHARTTTSLFAIAAFSTLASGLALGACQKRAEPVPTLTQDQWRRVQENLLSEAPAELAHPVDAVFGEVVRLVGWEIEPATPEAGEDATLVFYWEVLQATDQRWQIFVHLDAGSSRQNLDHEAIGGIYPSRYWEPGQIIRDEVKAELIAGLGEGTVSVYAGFFREDDRLEVTRAGQGMVEADGRLRVGQFDTTWTAPSYQVRRTNAPITIDGILDEPAWARARQTDNFVSPNDGSEMELETWAKVLWDDTHLYIAMRAEDPDIWSTLTQRDGDLWDEEVLEVYLDPGNNGQNYLEFQINPLNTVFDAVFAQATNRDLPAARAVDIAGVETAVQIEGTLDNRSDEDTAWIVEMKFPFASLPSSTGAPGSGETMRANFYRYDRSGTADTRYFAWSPVGGGTFHNPDRFGVMTFQGGARRRPVLNTTEGSGVDTAGAGAGAAAATTNVVTSPLIRPTEGSGPR